MDSLDFGYVELKTKSILKKDIPSSLIYKHYTDADLSRIAHLPKKRQLDLAAGHIAKLINATHNKEAMLANKNANMRADTDIDVKQMLTSQLESSVETQKDVYLSTAVQATDDNAALIEKDDLEITSFMGIDNIKKLQLIFNPESLYTYNYVLLDSNFRLVSDTEITVSKFRWNYSEQRTTSTGFFNSSAPIRDIIGMRLYQPRIPYVPEISSETERVSVLIEEFAAQSFIMDYGRRFHFLLRANTTEATPSSIELSTEDYNDGVYMFRKPITTIDSLTLVFANPTNILQFPTSFARFIIAIEFICFKSDK
jgi:hypothetical protein